MWKIILPLLIVITVVAVVLVTGIGKKAGLPSVSNPLSSVSNSETPNQTVTPQNADQILSQTNTSIDSDMTQLDKDLQALDQTNQSQDNTDSTSVNNL